MKRMEIPTRYLAALYRAEAVVTRDVSHPLYFNGAATPCEYLQMLLNMELPMLTLLAEITRRKENSRPLRAAVLSIIFELKAVFGEENGHLTHRYLQLSRNGAPLEPEQLDDRNRSLLDEYLAMQRKSFLKQTRWFDMRDPLVPFPGQLGKNDMDIAEVLALHLHTSLVKFPHEKYLIKEFIHYFCHAWNLSPDKDYYTLVSHALSRPHPTAFLEKIIEELQDHIEALDRKRV